MIGKIERGMGIIVCNYKHVVGKLIRFKKVRGK
jgi:hypothetical protein